MPKINEVIDSLTDEQITSEAKEVLKSEVNALLKNNSQLYQRAKKAEGFELDKTSNKWVKKEPPAKQEEPPAKQEEPQKNPNETDYGYKAYVAHLLGVKGEDEMKLVKEYTANGKSLEDLSDNKHFQNDLKDLREIKATKDATPSSTKRSGQNTSDTVEYWIAKGQLPPADQVELRRKVVNAKINQQSNANHFGA